MRSFLIMSAMLISVTFLSPQQTFDELTRETQTWLFDEPSAAYRLSAYGRGVEFCNHSRNKVMGFRLGCVEKRDGELSILSDRDFEKRELPAAGETVSCAAWGAMHGFPLTGCSKGQFAVVEVKLEDGTMWKLRQ